MKLHGKLIALSVAGLFAVSASAADLIVTYTGTVANGIDADNMFGFGAGTDLTAKQFTLTFDYDTSDLEHVNPGYYDQYIGASALSSVTLSLAGGTFASTIHSTYASTFRFQADPQEVVNYILDDTSNSESYVDMTGTSVFASIMLDTPLNYSFGPDSTQSAHFQVNGNRITLTAAGLSSSVSTVPEAGSWVMMLAGFGAIGAMRRRESFVLSQG